MTLDWTGPCSECLEVFSCSGLQAQQVSSGHQRAFCVLCQVDMGWITPTALAPAVAHYTVDGVPHESMIPVATGAFVKAKVIGLDPRYMLVVKTGHDEDLLVRDNQRIALDGRVFHTVPPTTGG